VVEAIIEVSERRSELGGYKITWQPERLRHFSCHFDRA
jgi:tryptophanase